MIAHLRRLIVNKRQKLPERSACMIGKMCCNTCASLDQEYRVMEAETDRFFFGCRMHGVIRKSVLSDAGLEHQSCDEWEATDEQKVRNRSIAEELGYELQALHDEWKQIYERGGTDFNCPDGVELNHLRKRIMAQRRRITRCLMEKDYPVSYELGIPDPVGIQYMARREEITAAAKRTLQIYKENKDYQWLMENSPLLSENERQKTGLYYALGYVEQLEKALEQDDCVLMRTHEVPEYYVEILRNCHERVVQMMAERKVVKMQTDRKKENRTEGQPQIPGQMDIFSFLAC